MIGRPDGQMQREGEGGRDVEEEVRKQEGKEGSKKGKKEEGRERRKQEGK